MSRPTPKVLLVTVALSAALYGCGRGTHDEGEAAGDHGKQADPTAATQEGATHAGDEEKHAVQVVTQRLVPMRIAEEVIAYGTVVADTADVRTISVPFESQIARVDVAPGEQLTRGAPLIQLDASPDALVALEEARNAAAASANEFKLTEQRAADHLATNIELSQARQAAQAATLKLESLTRRGVGEKNVLRSDTPGMVSKVNVQPGQIVPAGSPLIELAGGDRIEVRLNVEPSDAHLLKPGAEVALHPVSGADPTQSVTGKIRFVAGRVDPSTRLVDVRVALPPDTRLMLDGFVTGRLTRAAADGFVVPRDAAIANDEGQYTLFSVKDHRAVAHTVRIGLQQDRVVQVIADDIKPGDEVVVRGNYLLEDGDPVEMIAPATSRAVEAKPGAKQ